VPAVRRNPDGQWRSTPRQLHAAVHRRTGYTAATRTSQGLTTNQHILHLLLTVFTGGLWLPVWLILSIRSVRTTTTTAADPTAPMPEWPPPDPSVFGPGSA
jgi:hypothetical protein